MKKTLFCLLTVCALVMAACDKPEEPTENAATPATVDDYLGEFTMESQVIYVLSAEGLGEMPEDTTYTTSDIEVVRTSDDNAVLVFITNNSITDTVTGSVTASGLHINNHNYMFSYIDDQFIHDTLNITLGVVHNVVPVPTNGQMKWQSNVSGNTTFQYNGFPIPVSVRGRMNNTATKTN